MGLFSKIFHKPKESQAKLILISGVMASEIILEKNQFSKGAAFEVLLFSSLEILRIYKQKQPQYYSQFESEYFIELFNFAKVEGILNQIPGDFTNFVNNRFILYGQQLSSLYNNKGSFIPTKIAYNFYEKPLQLNSGDNLDLPAIMLMNIKIKHLFEVLDSSVELVLSGKFDNVKSEDSSYTEAGIQNALLNKRKIIFNAIEKKDGYFELSETKKQFYDQYLNYVCFITAGAILTYKLNTLGYTENDEECKRVIKAVYYNSLDFVKRFVTNNIIEFPPYGLDEKILFLAIKVKLEEYTRDIKEFFETGEPCYIEEMPYEDEEDGIYIHKIQHVFIREMYIFKLEETYNGISIAYHFRDYDHDDLDDKIEQTLNQIKSLSSR
ncbi:MAG TPA: hypothetical protein VIJ57_03955 [Hanamia sp.]